MDDAWIRESSGAGRWLDVLSHANPTACACGQRGSNYVGPATVEIDLSRSDVSSFLFFLPYKIDWQKGAARTGKEEDEPSEWDKHIPAVEICPGNVDRRRRR